MFVAKANRKTSVFRKQITCQIVKDRSYKTWKKSVEELYANDVFLKLTILNSDVVVINVEGTLHHESLLGHQMLAVGAVAVKLGKPVYWINVSVEKDNQDILKHALKGASCIAVREKRSFQYLKQLGVSSKLTFDTAVLARFSKNKSDLESILPAEPFCLFTGSNVKNIDLLEHVKVIEAFRLQALYLPLGLNDFNDLKLLKEHNIPHINFGEVNFQDILNLIKRSEFVISGRHHLNVFSILAAKPFVAHRSNTWKIEGVLDMLDLDYNFDSDLASRISKLQENYHKLELSLEKKADSFIKIALKSLEY
nr:polysaccharide pyruvyl transferase family protein [Tamlana crocina]